MKTFSEFNESLANYNKHKIKVKVSKDGGEKHHIDMTVHATSESEAKGIARMKLHKQGYTTHSASHQGIDYSWLKKEEVEQIDEAIDPSEVAGNPKSYDAKTVKAAYYHKKASESDKKALARHLDSHHGPKEWRKPVKEENLDELSSDLLQRYKDKAMKSADELTSKGKHKEANDRLLAHMKATGKQIEKTTADIRKAIGK